MAEKKNQKNAQKNSLRLIFLMVLMLFPGVAAAQEGVPRPPPVVIELFTSEVCPFCPSADALLGQLIKMDNVIGIGCHVDYMKGGRLGLEKPFCRQRQQNYVARLSKETGRRNVYTPQLIVNGRHEAIGYKGPEVMQALFKGRADKLPEITIRKGQGLLYEYDLPALSARQLFDVWLMAFDKPKTGLALPSRNNGAPVIYHNPAEIYQKLEPWDGEAQARSQGLMIGDTRAGFMIAAQDPQSGQIVAAGAYYFD